MVDKTRVVKVKNRDSGFIGYTIPDTGTHREFSPNETKNITFEELEKLSWARGGRSLLTNYLIVEDAEAAEELLGDGVEPEYYYDKEAIDTLLTEGTLDQLKDTLEFAPKGVVDLVKEEAVKLSINSVAMRDEIKKATNFDVTNAIELNKETPADKMSESSSEAATSKRRANPIATSEQKSSTSSAAAGSKYKIIG